jgi:hypothetical protein
MSTCRIVMLVLACLLAPSLAQGLDFERHLIVSDYSTVSSIALGDLDRDGDLDVAAVAADTGIVGWLLNLDGAGGSWDVDTGVRYAEDAKTIALADMDMDGDLDIVTLKDDAASGNDLIWEENELDGSSDFSPHSESFSGWTRWNQPADVDGDGDMDVVGCFSDDDEVYWIENDTGDAETSTWAKQTVNGSFNSPLSVFVFDVDGDGDLDILSTDQSEGDFFLLNGGDGSSWSQSAASGGTGHVGDAGTADLNGDGVIDVYSLRSETSNIAWMSAADGWTTHYIVPSSGYAAYDFLDAGDLDMDGDVDFVAVNSDIGGVDWLENDLNDSGEWILHQIDASLDLAWWVQLGDVDGDGDLDVVAAARLDDDIVWYENKLGRRPGAFRSRQTASTGHDKPSAVLPFDVDGDGDTDIVAAFSGDNNLRWFENDGDGSAWTSRLLPGSYLQVDCLALGHVTGAGLPDLIIGDRQAGEVTYTRLKNKLLNNWEGGTINSDMAGVRGLFAADFDGDGDVDVAGGATAEIAWWENDGAGGGWTERDPGGIYHLTNVYDVDGADFDHDGDMDIVAISHGDGDGTLRWYENDDYTSGGFDVRNLTWTIDEPTGVAAADIDGDGFADIALSSDLDGEDTLTWWRLDQTDNFQSASPTIIENDFPLDSVEAADLDHDGDMDLLGWSQTAAGIWWWQNNGDGSAWRRRPVSGGADGVSCAAVGDLDGDGWLDVSATGLSDDSVRWWPGSLLGLTPGIPALLLE